MSKLIRHEDLNFKSFPCKSQYKSTWTDSIKPGLQISSPYFGLVALEGSTVTRMAILAYQTGLSAVFTSARKSHLTPDSHTLNDVIFNDVRENL